MDNNENVELLDFDENTQQINTNIENLDSSSVNNDSILENNDNISTVEESKEKENKQYIFKIIRSIISCILLMVCLVISLMFYNRYKVNSAQYIENSSARYQVCLKENKYYKEKCLNEGTEYITSLTDTIRVDFSYNELYQETMRKDYSYYVKSSLVIKNTDENSKDLYKKEKKLTKRKSESMNGNVLTIAESIEIPFQEYSSYAQKYINDYSLIGKGNLMISLMVKDRNGEKEVSSVSIPVTQLTYSVTKNELINSINQYQVKTNSFRKIFFLVLTVLLGLLVAYRVFKTVLYIVKNPGKGSGYERELKRILNTYDKVIVTLTDKNTIVNQNEIYNVQTFLELLDVRDTIDKPILYHKTSDTETEFYVQDEDKTYMFSMKEADFTSK